jgi:outer membrane lipase/esterase
MIDNLLDVIGALYLAGARYVVVPNLPDLGRTPEGQASGIAEWITSLSVAFNLDLERALATSAPSTIRIDVFRLMTHVLDDPAEFGFTDVTHPCLTMTSVCTAPELYAFWDHVHPTTHGHAVLADRFARTINQAIVRAPRRR